MRYISTRGQSEPHDFEQTVLAGLAPDGGLFLPESLPNAAPLLDQWRELPFAELFPEVVGLFVGGGIPVERLRAMSAGAFGRFDHPEVIPVVPVGQTHVVELFHGPTFAFKDIALQFLGNLFEFFLAKRNGRLTLVGATSGDTGSAAIAALRGRPGIEVFILYPFGRISPLQQRQMTTVPDANIHAIAVEGSFDDAQAVVKGLFNDRAFNREVSLGAVNSINWVRVMGQLVYFFYAYFRLMAQGGCRPGQPVRFSVPTGNFGHILAGYLAGRMGLPVERLILASNANDILPRFLESGVYRVGPVVPTLSPSMDIQLASNFERYLFDLAEGDSARLRGWLETLARTGEFSVGPELAAEARRNFISASVSDETTQETIRQVYQDTGYLLDPHSAVGFHAAREHTEPGVPTLCMATAHPAKFGEAIQAAIGRPAPMPTALAGLGELPERVTLLQPRTEVVRDFIRQTLA